MAYKMDGWMAGLSNKQARRQVDLNMVDLTKVHLDIVNNYESGELFHKSEMFLICFLITF